MLRCWALVCAWAGTGVPDGRAAGRADGCLRAHHASPTPGSRESRWNSSRQCRLLCVASAARQLGRWREACGTQANSWLPRFVRVCERLEARAFAAQAARGLGAGSREAGLSGGRPPHSKTRLTCASPGHQLRTVQCVCVCVSPHRCSAASVCPASVARQATLFADGLARGRF